MSPAFFVYGILVYSIHVYKRLFVETVARKMAC